MRLEPCPERMPLQFFQRHVPRKIALSIICQLRRALSRRARRSTKARSFLEIEMTFSSDLGTLSERRWAAKPPAACGRIGSRVSARSLLSVRCLCLRQRLRASSCPSCPALGQVLLSMHASMPWSGQLRGLPSSDLPSFQAFRLSGFRRSSVRNCGSCPRESSANRRQASRR
jgi:hypothetical protein